MVGGKKAYRFLTEHGFDSGFAGQVKTCIQTHRFRKSDPPQSVEAKILFDADKLDVSGAIGIARTLIYNGIVSDPLYSVTPSGTVCDGTNDIAPSFFHEYKYKLENLYSHFYTAKGAELAKSRQQAAVDFYNSLFQEINMSYQNGKDELNKIVQSSM